MKLCARQCVQFISYTCTNRQFDDSLVPESVYICYVDSRSKPNAREQRPTARFLPNGSYRVSIFLHSLHKQVIIANWWLTSVPLYCEYQFMLSVLVCNFNKSTLIYICTLTCLDKSHSG